ncbi:MAG: amidohydrolase [Flavobacteriales bacterium]
MKRPLYLLLIILISSCAQSIKVDLIVRNATIISVDETMGEFEAMAVRDGKIIEIGAENQIMNRYQADSVIDAHKQFVYPGLIDAHTHFLGYGLGKSNVDLVGTSSFKEVVDRIKHQVEQNDSEWIIGRGWDQNDWGVKKFPNNDTLNTLFPDRKIVMKRIDGHAILATDNVLTSAGLTINSEISGGQVLYDLGILVDEAMAPVEKIIPVPTESQIDHALLQAQDDCFKHGLTSVTEAGLKVNEIRRIDQLQREGDLKMRIMAMYSAGPDIMLNLEDLRIKTDRLTSQAVKVYVDGALGSRGAKLLAPYSDDTLSSGLMITGEDSIRKWAKACYDADFQLCVHCIGDGGNRAALNAMSDVLQGTNDRRWRIEHAQVVNPEDRLKFGEYNILPSMQPTHVTSDMYWVKERLGQARESHAYSTRSLMEENGMIALGTDFPVEDISAISTFYAAVTRQDHNGFPSDGYFPSERLKREEALKGMTIWAAIANFDENKIGSLEAGKFADFVILDRNLLTCDDSEILQTQVLQTWLNGELVYEK